MIRVTIQQPALPRYRVAVFRELARRPGIGLTVIHGSAPGLTNAPAEGFEAVHEPVRRGRVFGRPVYWHGSQLRCTGRGRCDVAILSWDLHYASLVPALVRARASGVGTVLWGHGYSKREAGWRRRLRDGVARLATALLVYNHGTADRLVERGFARERVFVALNALDQAPIAAARERWLGRAEGLARFRGEQGLGGGPVVLFVSRLDPDNRVELLVRAAGALAGGYPGLRVVVIGRGDEERGRLARLAEEVGVGDRVRFVGPVYEEEELAPWFLSSDVFCYPANIGLSILHAFGYGLPVVTGDRLDAQNPEVEALRDGENGLLYRDGDAGALAGALRRLFDDRELLGRMRQRALETVTERFTLGAMVDGMEAAVRYCAAQRRRRAAAG